MKTTKKNGTKAKSSSRQVDAPVIPPQIERELPIGFIVKIDGIPFELTTTAKIKGHRNNFHLVNLVRPHENVAAV